MNRHINFIDKVNNPYPFYKNSDIFVLPSLWEGFGYVLAEALLSCLPVVAFDISSNSEVIVKSSGFLTKPHQVKSYCDKIEHLYSNPKVRFAMGEAGNSHVKKKFDSKIIFQRIEDYLLL